jgi:ubiquinone/menaquinone biosynthesis C-methylase UbiE
MNMAMRLRLAWFTMRFDIADIPVRLIGRGVRCQTAASVPEAPDVLVDMLTGTGSELIEYARRFPAARIIAVDMNPAILEVVRERFSQTGFKNLETITSDACDVPLPACFADAVNISFGLHETGRPVRGLILGECCRILKPRGYLVVSDYREVKGLLRSMILRLYLLLFEPRWIKEIFHGGLERQVEDSGFQLVRVRTDLPMTRLIVARKE